MNKSHFKIFFPLALLSSAIPAQAHEMGHDLYSAVMLDRLEMRNSNIGNSSYWEGQAWVGGDLDKAWFKTQGDLRQGKAQTGDAQLLYSRAISPYWDAQIGARHDFQTNNAPTRDWLAIALNGLAPYKFNTDASTYLGKNGAAARLKSSYTLLLTQQLALQPELEANFYSRPDPARALGSGLANLDVSLRLKYEISREFAPYLGITWSNKYGATANYARMSGASANEVFYAAGVRLWW